MRAEDTLAAFLNEYFIGGRVLADMANHLPAGHLVLIDPKL